MLDDGKLVVAHAGMKQAYQGRSSARVRDFALFGETTGETDEFGLPVRFEWARRLPRRRDRRLRPHAGRRARVGQQHDQHRHRMRVRRAPDGAALARARARVGRAPTGPTTSPPSHCPTRGRPRRRPRTDPRSCSTSTTSPASASSRPGWRGRVTVREENAAAALEVMSRFAIDPRWLVYLPPTMAPTATSQRPDLLEHPEEAFAEYRADGVPQVICEEKHMGSRAIVVVCRDADVAADRFGVDGGETGAIYTRTGRPFFDDRLRAEDSPRAGPPSAPTPAGLWDELDTGLAGARLRADAVVGEGDGADPPPVRVRRRRRASRPGRAPIATLEQAAEPWPRRGRRDRRTSRRARGHVDRYVDAYRRYVWPVDSVADLRLAPFHVLAAETGVFVEREHDWHLDCCDRLVAADREWFVATRRAASSTLPTSRAQAAAIAWWEQLTADGGEGMVVKPIGFTARGRKGLVQPGIKCRGREYLRIIYGPEYTDPSQIDRLRSRNLGRKRSLAIREFGLGVEALERFVAREPLYRSTRMRLRRPRHGERTGRPPPLAQGSRPIHSPGRQRLGLHQCIPPRNAQEPGSPWWFISLDVARSMKRVSFARSRSRLLEPASAIRR